MPSQEGTHWPLTVHRDWPGQAVRRRQRRRQTHAAYESREERIFFFPCCGLCLCLQRTVWQVEQAVVELKARPRERHLRGHDHGGWRRRQEESLAVGLQTPGAAQSEGRRQWNHELKTEKNNRITNHKIKICLFVNATNIYIYMFFFMFLRIMLPLLFRLHHQSVTVYFMNFFR